MAESTIALALVLALPAPHLLPLYRAAPLTAGAVWLLVLGMRAFASVAVAAVLLAALPHTRAFELIAEWCWSEVLPFMTTHHGGHVLAHAAALSPLLLLAASLVWMLLSLERGWRRLRRLMRHAVDGGPLGSTLLDHERVIVAVPEVGGGSILVSRAALDIMDDAELAACLAHERAHLTRRHRPLLLLGSVLAALGRPLPGTRSAERELRFSLERDADEAAVRETGDPLALASAICKVAGDARELRITGLAGGGHGKLRIERLLGDGGKAQRSPAEGGARLLAAALAALVVAAAASLPSSASVPDGQPHAGHGPHEPCHHDRGPGSAGARPGVP